MNWKKLSSQIWNIHIYLRITTFMFPGEEANSRPMTPVSEIAGATCASEETILEGEEYEEEEAQEAETLSREPTPPLLQSPWREVAVTGGE